MSLFDTLKLFGFKLKGKEEASRHKSFVPPTNDDGAAVLEGAAAYGVQLDLDGVIQNEYQLVSQYRDMMMQPEVDSAVEDITNSAIVVDDENMPVVIDVDYLETKLKSTSITLDEKLKESIKKEFSNVLELMAFDDRQAHDIFKRWYVDGRLYYHVIVNENRKSLGIQELRYIDPRQIRKIREVQKEHDGNTGAQVVTEINEYYLFNERGMPNYSNNSIVAPNIGLRIEKDAVAYCHSGLIDKQASVVLSFLHKAIKPLNQLRMMEDAVVIYRIARAPERRIFYVDTGNLPKTKAEEYLRSIMTKYRNRMVYNPVTGEVRDSRRYLSMLEDFWLPRSGGGSSGTEIDTLPGGQNLGEIQDIEYFQKKVFRSLSVPFSRFESDSGFNMGRASEITRDELKFQEFIKRAQKKFSVIFDELLSRQLILKNITTKQEWEIIKSGLRYKFTSNNFFSESKEMDILKDRIEAAKNLGVDNFVGTYYSKKQIRKLILKQSDDEIKKIDKEIEQELKDGEIILDNPNDIKDKEKGDKNNE